MQRPQTKTPHNQCLPQLTFITICIIAPVLVSPLLGITVLAIWLSGQVLQPQVHKCKLSIAKVSQVPQKGNVVLGSTYNLNCQNNIKVNCSGVNRANNKSHNFTLHAPKLSVALSIESQVTEEGIEHCDASTRQIGQT